MILFLTKDLLFQSRVVGAAQRVGQTIACGSTLAPLLARASDEAAPVLLIDLTVGVDLVAVVNQFREACPKGTIISYGPHVQEEALNNAASLGIQVYTRGQFDRKMDQILSNQPPSDA